jgi:lincosamide nucleotidyltransferase A/C/D/E
LFEADGIRVWVDGGWAGDALLGRQTRPRGDLDLAVQQSDLTRLRSLLETRGYSNKGEENARPWNFVLKDDRGHEVDLHVVVLDEAGNGVLGPVENGDVYPAHALTGTGDIGRRRVSCIAPEDLVAFHSGYELDEDDCRDVLALCGHFGMEVPAEVEAARARFGIGSDA